MSKNEDYQSLQRELDEVLAVLQSEDVSIEDALKNYERGMEIIESLQKQLEQAENKVQKIKAEWQDKS